MQPGRKRRLAAKRCDLAIELQERFLRQILGLGRIRCHAQAERVHAPLVLVVERLERLRVPLLGPFDSSASFELVCPVAVLGRSSCLFRPHLVRCG